MKILMLSAIMFLVSCGKGLDGKKCRDRAQSVVTCTNNSTPNYGYPYAQRMCNEKYKQDSCY